MRLVTIATFDLAPQARLAQNALKEAGIRAVVIDENMVAMDWALSNALGGVKVQVLEEDAEQAVTVLEQRFGEAGEGLGGKVTPEELEAEAEASISEEGRQQNHTYHRRRLLLQAPFPPGPVTSVQRLCFSSRGCPLRPSPSVGWASLLSPSTGFTCS